jgi:hypothetical protein
VLVKQTINHTAIEVMGSDRPGLQHSECRGLYACVRVASVMHVTDEETGFLVPVRL